MTKNQQYLLIGGTGIAALVGWWWWSNQQSTAASQITAQPTIPTAAIPPTTAGPVNTLVSQGNEEVLPVGTSSTSSGQDVTELNALLAWSNKTANPSLYAAMINALTPSQLDSLYNILVTEWTTGVQATPVQVAFWNGLVQQYPFLKTAGQGCTNFACN